jgi:predicted ATPase/DNA-binding SARP family transcriptional activator
VRFGVLGPLAVTDDAGRRRDPSAPRQRRLLLALLVWADDLVSTDTLVDAVWAGDRPPAAPVRALRTYVARLRRTLEVSDGPSCRIVSEGGRYRLPLDGHDLDAAQFEARVRRARQLVTSDPAGAARRLDDALRCWRGVAYAEVADEHWALPEVARLHELRDGAHELRAQALARAGDVEAAIEDLTQLTARLPLREAPVRELVVALAGVGRTADALAAYDRFRRQLADQTGLDPSAELQGLHHTLLNGTFSAPAAPVTVPPRPRTLPRPRTSFVGRSAEVHAVAELLQQARLVTLTGIGGIGKTRLALEVAHHLAIEQPDGVWLADLAPVEDRRIVAAQVLAAVTGRRARRVPDDTMGPDEALVTELRDRHGLLVVDNAEHLAATTARLVDRLLDAGPGLRVLVTSRIPLGLDGEQRWLVEPLATHDTGATPAPALVLLLDRLRALRPDLDPTPDELAGLATITQRTDGLPFALEFAAARLAHLTSAEVLAHLDDRLELFGDPTNADPRQRTLHAVLDVSYGLLDPAEQQLLRDLSVFAGRFSLTAAETVGRPPGDRSIAELLGSLVARAFVTTTTEGSRTEHRLLETVKLYAAAAADAAGETRLLHDRHRHWVLTELERPSWDHRVASPLVARRHAAQLDDLRRTLSRSRAEGRADLLARQLCAMSAVFCVRGLLTEGRRWHRVAAEDAAALPGDDAARLAVHRALVNIWTSLGAPEPYLPFMADLRAAIATLPLELPEPALARALLAASHLGVDQDVEVALPLALRARDEAMRHGALAVAGFAATTAGAAHLVRHDATAAVEIIAALVDHPDWEEAHDGLRTRAHLAAVRHLCGDQAGALRDATSSLERLGPAWQHDALGTVVLTTAASGRHDEASRRLADLLDHVCGASGTRMQRYDAAIVAGANAVIEEDLPRACRLLATMRWASNVIVFGTYLAYRRRVVQAMDPEQRRAMMAASVGLDVDTALAEERARLSALLGSSPRGR